jgi:hypothetical protein
MLEKVHSNYNNATNYSNDSNYSKKIAAVNKLVQIIQNSRTVEQFNEELEKLSKLTNIKISYYEDLFDSESEDKLRKNDFKRKNII